MRWKIAKYTQLCRLTELLKVKNSNKLVTILNKSTCNVEINLL